MHMFNMIKSGEKKTAITFGFGNNVKHLYTYTQSRFDNKEAASMHLRWNKYTTE